MDKVILALNTIASFLETGIGIWIFSKVFPKRERYGIQHQITIYVWYFLTVIFFYFNFVKSAWTVVYVVGCVILLAGHIVHKRFRKGKGENTILFLCLTAVMFCLLARNSWYGYLANGMDLLGGVLPPLLLFAVYQCSFLQAYLWEFFYLSSTGLLKLMYFIYASQTQGIVWYNHMKLNTYESIGYKFLIIVFVLVLIRFFPMEYLVERLLTVYKKWMLLITGMIWGFTYYMTMLGKDQFNISEMTVMLVATICLLISLLLAISKAFIKAEKAEKNLYEVRNTAVEQQYKELRRAYEQNRRFVHDQKHMVQYLEECLSRGEVQKAESFLSQYKDGTTQSAPKTWTGLPTLDFILNIKSRAMEQAGITFELKAGLDEIMMDEADFVVLMGNLFDNAIEAARKCALDNRKIFLSLQTVNQMFLIRMENTSIEMPKRKQEHFMTTKQNEEQHGWGIESMKYIVQKYEGDIAFHYDESKFCTDIIINAREATN
ncbi:MAG: ATP-binding protein [Lachnospiraceae bacterium]|uniref:ATP-binding protein n=1 Tax=Parablautia sp. Marseille-Q6255 TaxID=3039593 RepID=UPI0024BCAA1E|nr:sensor histidine kinase [Parablautia sp. Marseille-Q6255]